MTSERWRSASVTCLDVAVERRAAARPDGEAGDLVERGRGPRGSRPASRRAGGRGRRCRTPCGRRRRPGSGRGRAAGSRVTCGAPATSRVAASTAACHSGVPAVSVSEVYRRTNAEASTPSSSWSTCFARADSRSSRMKPPADSAAGACGANGSAASRTHRPRGDDPPAAADGEPAEGVEAEAAGVTCVSQVACYTGRDPGARGRKSRSARIDRPVDLARRRDPPSPTEASA